MTVVYVWLTDPSARLADAQIELEKSIRSFGLVPLRYAAGKSLVKLGDVLQYGRRHSGGEAFVWANSDVILTKDPYGVPDKSKVYGFRRREVPDGRLMHGVDMYYLPTRIWDEFLSQDIPPLFVGGSYVDWWISRAMERLGNYENLCGYIDHRTHGKSSAASSAGDRYYQANFRAYNSWALRNGLEPIPAPPYLIPKIGHVWGVRDALRQTFRRFFSS